MGRQPRCGQILDSAMTLTPAPVPDSSTPGTKPRLGSTSTTNASAWATYTGNPSRNGMPGFAATRSSTVPTLARSAALAADGHRNPIVPATVSTIQIAIPAASERRSSSRREIPVPARPMAVTPRLAERPCR